MRTTVTLDPDVERLLREAMRRRDQGFKEVLNQALRKGLADVREAVRQPPFKVKARPLGLRAGIDPASFNRLADDLEAEAFVSLTQRLSQPARRQR